MGTYDDDFVLSRLYGLRINSKDRLVKEGGDNLSSHVSDDITTEITCTACGKKFVINTAQIGEMTICPYCNTVMIALLDEDRDDDRDQDS